MKYISSGEFLKQPKEVQKSLLDWWQPEVGDVYCNLYNNQENNVLVINECQFCFKTFKDDIKKYGLPLLTEGRLRQFIEDKTKTKVLIEFDFEEKNYSIICFIDSNNVMELFDGLGDDLLQAYWKAACEIASK